MVPCQLTPVVRLSLFLATDLCPPLLHRSKSKPSVAIGRKILSWLQIEGCSKLASNRGMLRQRDNVRATMPIAARTLNIAQRNADRRFRIAGLKSKSTTVPQLSQAIVNQRCFDVRAAAIFGQNQT